MDTTREQMRCTSFQILFVTAILEETGCWLPECSLRSEGSRTAVEPLLSCRPTYGSIRQEVHPFRTVSFSCGAVG